MDGMDSMDGIGDERVLPPEANGLDAAAALSLPLWARCVALDSKRWRVGFMVFPF
jgi:hypothetical protein